MTEKTYTSEELRAIMHARFVKDATELVSTKAPKFQSFYTHSHQLSDITYV